MPDTPMLPPPGTIANLDAALAAAQAAIKPPKKSHTAKVPTKAGGSYSYRYSTLDELIEAVRDPLSRNGLAYVQVVQMAPATVGVETVLLHASGEQFACGLVVLPSGETPQSIGSALTYARRYSLSAACGVAAEDDDDGTAVRATAPKPASVPVALVPRELGDEPDDIAYAMGEDDAFSPRERRLVTPPGQSPTISEKQQKRLFAVAKGKGWTTDAIKSTLLRYGYEHTKDIRVVHYDDLVSLFEEGPAS